MLGAVPHADVRDVSEAGREVGREKVGREREVREEVREGTHHDSLGCTRVSCCSNRLIIGYLQWNAVFSMRAMQLTSSTP